MSDYLAFGLRRKWNDIGGQTVDFNRSNFVLKETDRVPMRSESLGRIVSK
jgi:hypothetical protein